MNMRDLTNVNGMKQTYISVKTGLNDIGIKFR